MGLAQKRNAAEQDDILMHVTCTRPVYLRTLAFDTYEGQRWTNSKDQLWADAPKFEKDAYDITGVRSLKMPSNFRGSEVEQRIEIKGPMDLGIPCGWIPQVLHFPNAIRVSTDGSLMSKNNLKEGLYYTAVSMVPSADLSELRKAGMPSAEQLNDIRKGSKRFLQLPKDYDPQIKLLAKEIGGKDGNWFVHAERVANYLKTNCSYLNSNNELEPGLDSVAQFLLHSKTGACSMFASAEAVLLRAQGIPARVVFGYLPGDKDPKSDVTYIRKKHEHAWAEVFIPTHGWVPIDPTPNGTLPVQPMQDASGGRRVFRSQRVEKAPDPSDPTKATKDDKSPWAWTKKMNSPYLVAILIAVIIFLLQDLARRAYAYFKSRQGPTADIKQLKPSTALYMRLLKDLEKVSVSKTTSDTPSDLALLVRTIAKENASFPPTLREELPLLVDNFVEAYYLERFSKMEESVEEGNKLGQIGDKIHALVAEGTLTSAQRN
ncbi:MAG: transglutaminase domain-containing protein [Leptolyngbya sp.]|nr:transglutaminase domain-containing protein [Candidatus Melainabacteria bacterium]